MRLRRAVPKIPAKSPVPPRSPLYKLRPLPTPSESTLPQLLIPLHFKSFISNTYKKQGRGALLKAPKFVNSPLRAPLSSGHTQTPTTSIPSFTSAHLPSPWGWVSSAPSLPPSTVCPAPSLPAPSGSVPAPPRTCHPEGIEGSAFSVLASRNTGHRPRNTEHDLLLTAHYSLPTHRATVLKKG